VAARTPFDAAAVVAHAAGAAHDLFEVGHFERNVIERRAAAEPQHHVVVIAATGNKPHFAVVSLSVKPSTSRKQAKVASLSPVLRLICESLRGGRAYRRRRDDPQHRRPPRYCALPGP